MIDLLATVTLLILFAVVVLVVIVVRYALLYVAIVDEPLGTALREAVALVRSKPWLSIEAAVLFFALDVAIGFGLTLIFFAVLIPWLFAVGVLANLSAAGGVAALLVVGLVVFVSLAAVSGGIITVFREALWAVFFTDVRTHDSHSAFADALGLRSGGTRAPRQRSVKKS